MTPLSVVSPRISQFYKELSKPKTLAEILLENAEISLERIRPDMAELGEEKLEEAHYLLLNASSSFLSQTSSNLDYAALGLKDQVKAYIHHSPDLFDDIKDWVKDKIKSMINTALEYAGKIYNFVRDTIIDVINGITTTVKNIYRIAKAELESRMNYAIKVIEDKTGELTSTVQSVFSSVYGELTSVGLAIATGLAGLITTLKNALEITPEDFMQLMFEIQEAQMKAQTKYVKEMTKEW